MKLKFIRTNALKNFIALVFGSALAQAVSMVSLPIVSRSFSPAQFGMLAVISSSILVLSPLLTLKFESTILLPKKNQDALNILYFLVLFSLALAILMLIILLLMPKLIKHYFGLEVLGPFIYLIPILTYVSVMIGVIQSWLNRLEQYKNMSKLKICQSTSMAIFSVLFGFVGLSSGLIYGQMLSLCITLTLAIIIIRRSLPINISLAQIKEIIKKYRGAPKFIFPTTLLDIFSMQLPIFLIASWFTDSSAGQYRMATMLMGVPSAILGGAVAQIFLQRFSLAWPNALAAKKILLQSWLILSLIGLVVFFPILLYGPEIFEIFLGVGWRDAGIMASILSPMIYLSLIQSPTSTSFVVMGIEKCLPFFGIVVMIYRPLALYIGLIFNDIKIGLIALCGFEILQMAFFQFMVLKKINSELVRQ